MRGTGTQCDTCGFKVVEPGDGFNYQGPRVPSGWVLISDHPMHSTMEFCGWPCVLTYAVTRATRSEAEPAGASSVPTATGGPE